MATLYEILKIDTRAKPTDVRDAYRRLARNYHPDVNPDPGSHERMARINAAFEILIDPVRRMEYDASLNGGLVLDPISEPSKRGTPPSVRVQIEHRLQEHKTPIYGLSFAPDTGTLVSSSFDNELIWWDLEAGTPKRRTRLDGGVVNTIQALPDDRVVAAGCTESAYSVWRVQGGTPRLACNSPTEWVCCLHISADGGSIAVGSVHSFLQVASTEGHSLFTSTHDEGSVTALAWSPDNRRVASGTSDATVRLLSTRDGREEASLQSIRSTVTALAFSPDGNHLAVAAVDLSIRIFDLRTNTPARTLFGHQKPIESLAYHPSGAILGSVGRDGCVGLWDTQRGVGHGKIEASHLPLSSIAFSPDGKKIVAGGLDKVLRVWSVGAAS